MARATDAKLGVSFEFSEERGCVVCIDDTRRFGDIEIYDDACELTVVFGRFTHAHFGCYREDLSNAEVDREVASEVVEVLRKTFCGELLFYGSHDGCGGCEPAGLIAPRNHRFADFERFAWPAKSV